MSSPVSAASQFLDELKDALVKAFMNAPQLDGRTNARVPLDLAVPSQAARERLMENQSGNYWATVPQLPIVPSSA
jgi:hypothetical protein